MYKPGLICQHSVEFRYLWLIFRAVNVLFF